MEQILLRRVELRKDRLSSLVDTSLQQYEQEQLDTEKAAFVLRQLKDFIQKLDEEIKHYTATSREPQLEMINAALETQMAAEDLVSKIDFSIQTTQSRHQEQDKATRLPKLELPKYNGDRLKWSEFWDRFRANVHQRALADADKLSYLLSCLEGTALDAVSGLSTTDANYTIAIETLQDRFGSHDILIDAHYTALNSLSCADYTSASCRSMLDTIERHLKVLEKLGEPVNGNHFRAIILSKFPEKVVHEHHLRDSGNSMVAIRKNLHSIITAMEKSTSAPSTVEVSTPIPCSSGGTTEALQVRVEPKRQQVNRKRKGDTYTKTPPTKKPRRSCIFCKRLNHSSAECRTVGTVDARKEKLSGRCLRCLNQNHRTSDCRKQVTCYQCKGDHLKLLCPNIDKGELSLVNESAIETVCEISHGHTFLQTAVAKMINPESNRSLFGRLLLDSGSQRSYISSRAANKLGLSNSKEDLLLIYTFGASSPTETSSPSTEIRLETKRGIVRKMQVNIVPHITDRVLVANLKVDNVDIFADDNTTGDGIDLLVGNDFYCFFIRDDKVQIDTNLYLIDTDFGWVLSGNIVQNETPNILSVTTYCQCHIPSCPYFTEPDLPLRSIDMKFLWSLECIGITDSPKATWQEEAVRHFNETVQYQDGRYEVKWPWIQFPPDIPSNFGLALGRLKSLIRRMDKESRDEYVSILKEQLELGIIEVVDENSNQSNNLIHYLSHHIVKQKGKRGRLVYDASAKTTGQKCLNECLYSGPSMLEDLTALLLKFRTKKIGLTADVEKAFLQVGLQSEDRDVTRFLWVKDLEREPTPDNLLHLRFCRVPFGVISSPFLLTATIRHHMAQTDGNLMKAIADKCYVDNLVTGTDSVEEAEETFQKARTSFQQLAMNIRDWVSNSRQFMELIPEEYKAKQTDKVKVLGLLWDVEKDMLKLKTTDEHFSQQTPPSTKRQVLRTLARVYDPCGFVCPLTLPIKLLFQQICERKVKWDIKLPEDLTQSVEKTLKQLRAVSDVELQRYIGIESPDQETVYELHCFTDSSMNAYAAVIYLKAQGHGETTVSFVMAKSHVSRTEDKTDLKIPKLELLGYLIGSRLLKYTSNNLDLEIKKMYLWTDSLVVLGWMRSNKLLPPFVANRVNEIKRNHQQTEMCYIHTKSNPADIATRPELWEQKKELWYNGPEFLKEHESCWPSNRHYDAHKTFLSVGEALEGHPGEMDAEEFNDQIIVDEVPVETIDPGIIVQDSHNTLDETTTAIKKLQRQYFLDEVTGKRTHLGRNLDLFLDVDGVLRCRGRMANTTWSYDMKYPVLLPKDCEFTNKVIKDIHEKNYHVGAAHTLAITRERYWIPQGKAQVQKVLRRCPQCVKHGGGPYKLPPTPALPRERVNYSHPFAFSGLDYFGPLYVASATGREKRWVALFTCLTVRVIHLEIVKDLTAEESLLALRRFTAIRGVPQRIYSDNATYFKLASEVMTKPYCIEREIQWKFIPQLAPWHGGFYERLVALVKHRLKRTLEKHLLNDSKLLTVMKEVEAVVNSRPLTRVGTEIIHILRPADFLSLGKCLTVEPSSAKLPCEGTTTKTDLIESWRKGLRILEAFKQMFVGQYLTSLRERSKHAPKQPRIRSDREPRVGDVVQIKSDSKNRDNWKVGKIESLIEGADNECRVAKVNVDGSIFIRSIGHLYPLEADSKEQTQPEQGTEKELERADGPTRDVPVRFLDLDLNMDVESMHMPDQAEERDAQSHRDINPNSERTSPMEMDSILEAEETGDVESHSKSTPPANNRTPEFEEVSTSAEPQQSIEVNTRGRRDAAVRAREKILEWTRHLLALLE